jgi:hypothetical protein
MKWNALAGALATLLAATVSLADTPVLSGGRNLPGMQMPGPLMRSQMYAGQNWWSRFGEAVNADAIAQEPIKASHDVSAPVPIHGDGYIYGPGSCDCPPPCIWHLWDGYEQHPMRCDPYVPLFHRCGCGACGGCGKCNGCKSCAAPVPSCTTKVGCEAPISCTSKVGCGCKPVCGKCRHFHFSDKWKCFTAHWHRPCKSCSTPISCGAPVSCGVPVSCGCATPVYNGPPGFEKQAVERPPLPLPEDAALLQLPRLN